MINTTRFVSIGDSITAGYADGALFFDGQHYTFASFIAKQVNASFNQAYLSKESVGIGFFGNSRMVLSSVENCDGKTAEIPVYKASRGDLKAFAINSFQTEGPYNNMGVPGAKVTTLLAPGYGNPANGTGNFNPFFTRMASNPANTSVLSDALSQNPSFFTLFIGNNDVLAFALSGGTTDVITPLEGDPGYGFKNSYFAIINALTANGAKGIVATIPYITSIPFFTTIPFNGLNLTSQEADELNILYKDQFKFIEGNNAFVIEDPRANNGRRQLQIGELVLSEIILDPDRCAYLTGKKLIPKKYFLTLEEVESAHEAVGNFNRIIKGIAAEKELALADVCSFVSKLKNDRTYKERKYCIEYNENALFSLDGLHLSAYGQSMLSNVFIDAINNHYKTDIVKIDINEYKGVLFE